MRAIEIPTPNDCPFCKMVNGNFHCFHKKYPYGRTYTDKDDDNADKNIFPLWCPLTEILEQKPKKK